MIVLWHLMPETVLHCTEQRPCCHTADRWLCYVKDTVPAENSVISMLMKANNKATGAAFTPV